MAVFGDEQIEFPVHLNIRCGLQQRLNRISSNTEAKFTVPVASHQACIATASRPTEKSAKDICRSVNHPALIASTTKKHTMMDQTQLELGRSIQTSGAFASVKPTAAPVPLLVPQPSSPVRTTSGRTGSKITMNQHSKPLIKKFKTKFSSFELRSSPLKYAAVTITKVTQPRSMYIRIEDDDELRYLQLLKEMELEFRSATTTSASFCSSPIIGSYHANCYLFKKKKKTLLNNYF